MFKLKKVCMGIMITSLLFGLCACGGDKKSSEDVDDADVKMGDVELGDYFGVEVSVDKVEVTDSEVNDVVSQYLKRFMKKDEDAKVVKKGDIVNIDYVGKQDGKEFEGGKASDQQLEIGSNTFIPGFEDALIGKKVGSNDTIKVKFPEEYREKSLAGKDATFDVKINYIYSCPKELTDEIVASDDTNTFKTAKEYLESLRKEIKKNKDKTSEEKVGELVVSKIMDNCKFDNLNKDYIEKNYEKRYSSIEGEASARGQSLEDYIKQMYGYQDKASFEKDLVYIETDFTKKNIMLDEVAKKENITVSDEEYDKQVESWVQDASKYQGEVTKEKIIESYGSEKAARKEALRVKVMKELIGKAKVTYKKPSKDDKSDDSKKADKSLKAEKE